MFDNDDAEYARREHDYEMDTDTPEDIRWDNWSSEVERGLIRLGFTNLHMGLDGDQETDGFSLDFAYDFYRDGSSPEEYIEDVILARHDLEAKA